jgi:hypothetical protein
MRSAHQVIHTIRAPAGGFFFILASDIFCVLHNLLMKRNGKPEFLYFNIFEQKAINSNDL